MDVYVFYSITPSDIFFLYFIVLVMIRIRHKAMCLPCAVVTSKAIPLLLPLKLFQMCLRCAVVTSKAIPDVSALCCCYL